MLTVVPSKEGSSTHALRVGLYLLISCCCWSQ